MSADEQLQALITQLDDPTTQETALRDLANTTDPRLVAPLSRIIRERAASSALAYRPRQMAAELLGSIGDKNALAALIYGTNDPSDSVKCAAATALGKLDDPRAIPSLMECLQDKNVEVREAAIQSLGTLGKNHDVPITDLVNMLADFADEVREKTMSALRGLGAKALDPLIDALTHPNSTIRGAAATLLGELGDSRAYEFLMEVNFDDKSEWVRGRAQAAMKRLPKPDFPMIKRPKNQPPPPIDTLKLLREQAPKSWPTLKQPANPPTPNPEDMSAAQIREMLDQLDVRLVNGEISEATYARLVARWEARLNELE